MAMIDANSEMNAGRGRVAVVDDDEAMRLSLSRILSHQGFSVTCFASGVDALAAFRDRAGDFDLLLTDLNMSAMDGLELMRQVKAVDSGVVAIVLTGFPSSDNAISALRCEAFDFLEKPFSIEALSSSIDKGVELRRLRRKAVQFKCELEKNLETRNGELKKALESLEASYLKMMEVIVQLLELKEPNTAEHSLRVNRRSALLAVKLGVPQGQALESIRRGALLHDIGKVGVPDAILNKPSKLEEDEYHLMMRHPMIGYEILKSIPGMEAAAEIVISHHERFDGKGYPRHLSGQQICLGARIFSVVDAYDALRCDRCYRKGVSMLEALAEIERNSGTQFDPEIVAAFKACIEEIDKA